MLPLAVLRSRLLPAAAALALAACAGGPPAPALDPDRTRLLGGLPPDEAARGVYVVDLQEAGELSPGSRVAPLVAPLVDDAKSMVETAAPPITLLGGVDAGVDIPAGATRIDDVIVIAEPAVRDEVVARVQREAQPEGTLTQLATASAPVAWAGPTPAPNGTGTTVAALSEDSVRFAVDLEDPSGGAVEHARRELLEGGPAGSPGKPWRSILAEAEVSQDGDRLVVTGVPADLPGLFFRVLIDQRQITFLPQAPA